MAHRFNTDMGMKKYEPKLPMPSGRKVTLKSKAGENLVIWTVGKVISVKLDKKMFYPVKGS